MTDDLPAVLRLPQHQAVLPLAPDARLLGLHPDTALAVEGLSAGLSAMLDELVEPVPVAGLIARAEERGAALGSAEALLAELVRVGALVDAAGFERQTLHRAESAIVVSGDGPLAVGVVLGLVQAGVGAVHPQTGGCVRVADLGTGYLDVDRGQDRASATRDAVRRVRPEADAAPAPRRLVPDLVVLADVLAPDPARLRQLHAAGVAHLPVRLRDGIGVVGPLVLPGRTACLRCLDLCRSARAPDWPTVAAQLTGRRGRAEPEATAATAGLATAQALAALDSMTSGGSRPPTLETTIELDVAAGTLRRRHWSAHEACGCGATEVGATTAGGPGLDDATSGDGRGRETIMV